MLVKNNVIPFRATDSDSDRGSGVQMCAQPQVSVEALRGRYGMLCRAAEYDPGRLSTRASYALLMHTTVAQELGIVENEDIYCDDPIGETARDRLREILPDWFGG